MSLQQIFGRFVTSLSVDGVERLGWVLVHSVWQLALLALAAALTVRAMRRSSAASHYIVLVTAMGFSILIPVTTWVLLPASPSSQVTEVDLLEPEDFPITAGGVVPAIRLRHGDSLIAPYGEGNDLESNLDAGTAGSKATGVKISPQSGDEKPWLERLRRTARPWMTWIVAGWISGVLIFAFRPLLGWRMLRRLRHTGVAAVSEEVNGVLRSAACRLGLHRTAAGVLQSTLVQVPIVVGYLRPLILLPASLITSIPPTQLEAILAHELAHIVRHDFLVNLLQTLIETLFFYHPAVWWLSHRIRIEREHCCDDLVVSTWGNQVEYGRALLAVAELRRQSHVLALGATDGSLRSRVGRLFHVGTDRPNDRLMNRLPATMLSLACLGVTMLALLAAHLPVDADDTSASTTEESASREIPIAEVSTEGGADQRYVAEIPGGIKVEFVGITRNTALAREGWRPDGLKMGEIPEWPEGLVMYGQNTTGRTKPKDVPLDENGRDYLFEFQGLRRQPSFSFEMQTGGSYSHDPLQDPYRLRVSTRLRDESQFPQATFDPPADEVRVGLTDEPWGEWQQVSVTGELLNNVAAVDRYPKSYSQIEILRVGPSEHELHPNQTSLYLRQPNEARSLYAFEIRGIDDEGKNLWVTELQSQRNKNNGSSDAEWGLALALPEGKRLVRFEFRLRPYRHWVTFKGVSVEPGTKSKVSVQLKSMPAEAVDIPESLKNESSTDGGADPLSNEQPDPANNALPDDSSKAPANESSEVENRNDQRRVSLTGRVSDAGGNPVAKALVLYPVRVDAKARKFRLARTTSNERGEFTLQVPKILFGNDPRKVHHIVWCWAEGHGIGTVSIRSQGIDEPRPPILIKLPDIQPQEFVVLSEDRQPLAGAIVAPSIMQTPEAYYPLPDELKASASRTSDEKGRVRLELVPKDVLDAVSVTTKSHGEQQFSHLSGNLQLLPVASVEGNIQGGLPGVRLLFCNYLSGTRCQYETITDRQGRFTIPAFPAGQYTVNADLPGPLMLASIGTLEPGHQTLTLQVDRGIPVKGRLVVRGTDRGVKNTFVAVRSGFNLQHDFDVTSNDQGEFQSFVLPGHQMRVQVYGFDPNEHFVYPGFKTFEVPDGVTEFTVPDIEIDPAKAWKGTLVDVNNVPLEGFYVEPEAGLATPDKTASKGKFEVWLREKVTPSGWQVTQTSEGTIVGKINAEVVSENPLVIRIPRSHSQLEEEALKRQKAGKEGSNDPAKVPRGDQPKKTADETSEPLRDDSRKQAWMKWHLDPRLDMPFSETMNEVPVHVALADIAEQLNVVLKIHEPEIFAGGGNEKTMRQGVTLEGWPERLKILEDSPHEPDAVRLMLLRNDGTINFREVLMLITEPIELDFLLVDDVLHVSTVEGIRSLRQANSVRNTAKANDPAE